MIYNARYVIPGLLLFAGLVSMPFVLHAGKEYQRVKPALPAQAGANCIEPREYMAASHMTLLSRWRDRATRENLRQYTALDGKAWTISLNDTCFSCHTDKAAFCDTCHTAVGVSPNCWTCHAVPASPATPQPAPETP